jgi:Ca2+-dependent lipid-binding protein
MFGKTETIMNNLNPDFTKIFTIDYFFEKEQYIKIEVYDYDSPLKSDFIGQCEFTVSKLMTS